MKNQISKILLGAALVFGVGSTIDPSDAFAQSSATVGSLRGIIKDKQSNGAALGATVVATSPALVGEQVVLTDADGSYFITALPPGLYTLTLKSGAMIKDIFGTDYVQAADRVIKFTVSERPPATPVPCLGAP